MALQWVLRNWLQNAAREKIYQAASEAMRGGAGQNETSTEDATEEKPAHVGLVFGTGSEAGGLEDRLSGVTHTEAGGAVLRIGGLGGRRLAVVESGPGLECAARATRLLIAGHRPAWIVAAGFAGGLVPHLNQGDFLLADQVSNQSGRTLQIDLHVPAEALAQKPNIHVGLLLTADAPVRTAEAKRTLASQTPALAVDQETFAVAEVCQQEKVRFLAVRVVLDALNDERPADLERVGRQKTTARRLGAAVGTLINRPSSVKDVWRLKEQALVTSDRLGQFLEGIVSQLG